MLTVLTESGPIFCNPTIIYCFKLYLKYSVYDEQIIPNRVVHKSHLKYYLYFNLWVEILIYLATPHMKIGIKNVEFTAWIFKNVYVMALTKVFSTALVHKYNLYLSSSKTYLWEDVITIEKSCLLHITINHIVNLPPLSELQACHRNTILSMNLLFNGELSHRLIIQSKTRNLLNILKKHILKIYWKKYV